MRRLAAPNEGLPVGRLRPRTRRPVVSASQRPGTLVLVFTEIDCAAGDPGCRQSSPLRSGSQAGRSARMLEPTRRGAGARDRHDDSLGGDRALDIAQPPAPGRPARAGVEGNRLIAARQPRLANAALRRTARACTPAACARLRLRARPSHLPSANALLLGDAAPDPRPKRAGAHPAPPAARPEVASRPLTGTHDMARGAASGSRRDLAFEPGPPRFSDSTRRAADQGEIPGNEATLVTVQSLRSGERGEGVAAGVGGEQFGQVVEQRALLLAASGGGGEGALSEPFAVV